MSENLHLVSGQPLGPYPDPSLAPWPGFVLAADAAVTYLSSIVGMDLWLVTHVEGDQQRVVASSGDWADLAAPGTAFSWTESFCVRMVQQQGPTVALDVSYVPTYARAATGVLGRVRSYLGVPVVGDAGLFGTICAFAGAPAPESVASSLPLVRLLAQMLSTILAREQAVLARSEEAAAAYALAERDRLTGLRNRRGWESSLRQEETRCKRYGSAASAVVMDLDDLKTVNDESGHAAGDALLRTCGTVLSGTCRPGDALARLGGDEFGVLAVECDAACARSLVRRLRIQLRSAGVSASLGTATRRPGEDLVVTWRRADEAMYRDKRRHKRMTDSI